MRGAPQGCAVGGSGEEFLLMSRRPVIYGLIAVTVGGAILPACTTSRHAERSARRSVAFDLLDLAQARAAGSAQFDVLDLDHNKKLTRTELAGRLNALEFIDADRDFDGRQSKTEYLAVVDQRFKAADANRNGSLDAQELRSPAGLRLLRLLS